MRGVKLLLIYAVISGNCLLCSGQARERTYTSPFRYVIAHDEVIKDDDPSYTHRDVEVLLEEKAFSEATLRQLFGLLAKRFPQPERLDVSVYTSLEQIDTPEERDAGRIFVEGPTGRGKPTEEELALRRHPYATLMRRSGSELFRYALKPDYRKLKTVVLSGKGW
jgi:hypothetical protein